MLDPRESRKGIDGCSSPKFCTDGTSLQSANFEANELRPDVLRVHSETDIYGTQRPGEAARRSSVPESCKEFYLWSLAEREGFDYRHFL